MSWRTLCVLYWLWRYYATGFLSSPPNLNFDLLHCGQLILHPRLLHNLRAGEKYKVVLSNHHIQRFLATDLLGIDALNDNKSVVFCPVTKWIFLQLFCVYICWFFLHLLKERNGTHLRKLCSGFFRNASVLGSTKSNFQLYSTCSPWTWSMAQCCLITQLQKSYKEGQSSVLQQFDWLAGRELCFFKRTLTN